MPTRIPPIMPTTAIVDKPPSAPELLDFTLRSRVEVGSAAISALEISWRMSEMEDGEAMGV